jgi:hypothetical protein
VGLIQTATRVPAEANWYPSSRPRGMLGHIRLSIITLTRHSTPSSSQEMYSEDWQSLGDVQYRRWECYSLDWGVSVDEHHVVGAPFGGPLALVRDDKKMVRGLGREGGGRGCHIMSIRWAC